MYGEDLTKKSSEIVVEIQNAAHLESNPTEKRQSRASIKFIAADVAVENGFHDIYNGNCTLNNDDDDEDDNEEKITRNSKAGYKIIMKNDHECTLLVNGDGEIHENGSNGFTDDEELLPHTNPDIHTNGNSDGDGLNTSNCILDDEGIAESGM